ncbi:MAG TPA: glycosyltransferase 87 family protein, partial [Ktedonobacterales bacterium]|nr:glycosyltransferase 87 family protein [Ktedonobacterales bacterium]
MRRQRETVTAEAATPARARRWGWLALELAVIAAALAATRWLSINLWLLPNGDVKEYYNYAVAFWTWHPYFHNLPVEYPPLAIVPFTLTVLPPILDYQTTFAIWMGALVVLGYFGFLRYSTRARGLIYVFYLVLGAAATLLARYDIVPALVTLAALWAADRRRFGLAYALLAAGILLKLYPAFLVPIVAIEHWRVASARAAAEGRP